VSFSELLAAADRAILTPLGSAIGYTPDGAAPVSVIGIFDSAFVRVAAGEAGVASSGPAVFFLLNDLPVDPEDDDPVLSISGVDYVVTEVNKDGVGGVILHLHRK
jgi:hypothetical protein